MLNADEEVGKQHNIVAANSSWHKQVLLLQDDYKTFMPETNQCYSVGTLSNFRSRYGHTQVNRLRS
jgi:hypothetical protein